MMRGWDGFVSWRSALAVALMATGLAACVQETPSPVYAPPPPQPRAMTITAQRRQSQAQQDRDKGDCQAMASREATSSTTWAQIFTACMGGRGYMVQ